MLLHSGGRAVGTKEVLLVQVLGLDVHGLGVPLGGVQVRRPAERLNVQPTHQVHQCIVLL